MEAAETQHDGDQIPTQVEESSEPVAVAAEQEQPQVEVSSEPMADEQNQTAPSKEQNDPDQAIEAAPAKVENQKPEKAQVSDSLENNNGKESTLPAAPIVSDADTQVSINKLIPYK